MYLVTFVGFCDFFLSWFSYFTFGYAYVYARDDAAAAAALADTFDEYGCDQNGLDADGAECPAVVEDEEEEAVVEDEEEEAEDETTTL